MSRRYPYGTDERWMPPPGWRRLLHRAELWLAWKGRDRSALKVRRVRLRAQRFSRRLQGGATHLPSFKAGGIIPPVQLGWIDYQVGERLRASVNGEHCEMEVVAIDGSTLRLKLVEP